MAGGGSFINNVISYVVNEVIVNGLANSPSFQRFAVRTSKRIEDLSNTGIMKRMEELSNIAAQKNRELAKQMKDAARKY